jgi:hypothetical protein
VEKMQPSQIQPTAVGQQKKARTNTGSAGVVILIYCRCASVAEIIAQKRYGKSTAITRPINESFYVEERPFPKTTATAFLMYF